MLPPPPFRIMHVDDDNVMRLMIKTALVRSTHEFTVESCASASEVLEKIADFQPHLLLADMKMPIMDGMGLVQEIRSKQLPHSKVPVVFITGKDDVQIENRDLLEPILGIIHKPFSPVNLGDDIVIYLSKIAQL